MLLADDLITSVKRAITVPSSQALLTNDDMLKLADEVIGSRIVPLLESLDEEFFITLHLEPMVRAQSDYKIPYRSAGRALRDIKISGDGSGTQLASLPKIALEDSQFVTNFSIPTGFHFMGDVVRLVPPVQDTEQRAVLFIYYRLPPSKLVTSSGGPAIASISYGPVTDTITVNNVPSTIQTGTLVDFIQAKSGSPILAMDRTVTGISGTQLSFNAGAVPTDLIIGDFVAPAGYSPVLNAIPNEMLSLVRSHVSYRVLMAIGDYEAAKMVQEDIRAEERDMKSLLQPRIDGEPTVIINRSGLVRGMRFASNWWFTGR